MKESYSFLPIKEEIEGTDIQPITADEHEEAEPKPMTLKDHWLSLRQSIQDKLPIETQTDEEERRTKILSELITPELMHEYSQLISRLNERTKIADLHPQREFVDINSEAISHDIENWISALLSEIKKKNEIGLDETDEEDLRAQCWMFFDSIGNVMNTRSLENDIAEYYKGKETGESDTDKDGIQKSKLVEELHGRYPLDKAEIEILVDLIRLEGKEDKNYSLRLLVETISRLWGEYNLGEKKGTIAKISLGYLMSKGAESFSPSLFQDMFADSKFNVAVFMEWFGLDKFSTVVDAKIDIELAKIMNEINHQVNERITNSLFFQEFEFIHEKSLGEIFATLERGKNATENILQDVISKFAPTLTGIAMSLGFLAKINPILGAIGVGSLPVMYKIARKQNKKIAPMYEREKREGEKIETRLGSIKSGFEEVKTSPETPTIAAHVKEQMNVRDTLSLSRTIEETKMKVTRMIPFDISTMVAAGVGGALQEAGMISGGAILSNIIYSSMLNRPVQELVNLYFSRFSRYIQDIQRMDEIMGKYDKLDLPEGEMEKDRMPVSELENFDISIKDLRFKDILKGISIDVKQGEFLTISGTTGAGKSTLLRNLAGLYKPDSGAIEIGGIKNDEVKKYGSESLYSVMSYCNQSPQIFEGMSFRENLLLWSKNEVDDEKIKKVLQDLHLDKFVNKLNEEVKNLSGGEKVRIGVARTLIKGAKIMLLDEPTGGLDSETATEIRNIISEINKKYPDTTIICVSHDQELIKSSKRSVNMAELQE